MASNEIKVKLRVDDDGNLSIVGKKAKAAAQGLEQTANSARTADRALKGAAKASSNSTKNFSKMAQGISGGLVPAYATLAANIFAVSAAFQFLKDAGNLVALQRGQEAYAASTGVALRSLANDIVAATDAQISFVDASQAAAIGTASGLGVDQLNALAEGAKNVSIILGRDVTDSFNRLIRGVTKAEPELLDELGIILRLDRATSNYSRTINKNAKDFSEYVRSQAVAVEVLTQLEDKYNRIAAVTDLNVNKFNQLGKAFDSIINRVKELTANVLGPLAEAITESPVLGIALMGLFAKGVITAALPAIGDFAFASREAFEAAEEKAQLASQAVKELGTTTDRTAGKLAAAARAQKAAAAAPFKGAAFTALAEGRGGELSSRQISGMLQQVKRNEKIKGDEFKKTREVLERELQTMLDASRTTNVDITKSYTVAATGIKARFAQIRAAGLSAFAAITRAANIAAVAISKTFAFLGYVGLAVSLFEIVRGYIGFQKEAKGATDELALQEKQIELSTKKLEELNQQYAAFVAVQSILTEDGTGALQFFQALGNQITSLSSSFFSLSAEEGIKQYTEFLRTAPTEQKRLREEIERANGVLARQRQRYAELGQDIPERFTKQVRDLRKELRESNKTFLEFLLTSEDTSLSALGNRIDGLQQSFALLNERFGRGPQQIREFADALAVFSDSSATAEEQVVALEVIQEKYKGVFVEVGRLNNLQRLTNENTLQYVSILQNLGKETREATLLRTLKQELEELEDTSLGLYYRELDRILILEKQIKFTEQLVNLEANRARDEARLELTREISLRNRTRLNREAEADRLKIVELQQQERYLQGQIALLEFQKADASETFSRAQEDQLDLLKRQRDLLKEQQETIRNNYNLMQQYANAVDQAYETGLQQQLGKLFKGEESSIKDAILSIAKGIVESVAETAAENLTRMITGAMSGSQAAATIGTAMINAGQVVASTIATAITGAFAASSVASVLTSQPSVINTGTSLIYPRPSTQGPIYRTPVGQDYSAAQKFGSMFGLGEATFANVRPKASTGGGLSSILSFFQNLWPFANGGMIKGGFRAYANGGIASNPTLGLIGEGRYNEAIVPLPNGKAIPVDMKGSGQQNNVTVNVSVDGTTSMQQDSSQAGNLGKVIARAVQQELQNQKRSGGILSPYGAA